MFMKRILAAGVAGAFLAAGIVAASAADLPAPPPVAPAPPPPAPMAPAFDWSGLYIGAYGGAIVGGGPTVGQAGIQAGFNMVRGAFLAGLEAQIGAVFGAGGVAAEGDVNARLGAILGERVLLYGEAGIGALTDFTTAVAFWTAGGGLEFAVGDRTSLFGEAKVLGAFSGGCCAYVFQGGLNFHPGN
jgi:opacity protein-like surface antigen